MAFCIEEGLRDDGPICNQCEDVFRVLLGHSAEGKSFGNDTIYVIHHMAIKCFSGTDTVIYTRTAEKHFMEPCNFFGRPLREEGSGRLLRQVGLPEEGRAEGPRGPAVEADLEAGAVLVGAHDDALPEGVVMDLRGSILREN